MGEKVTKTLTLNGIMIALVFLATYFTHIPTPLPGGYFNLGDAVIMVAALLLGRKSGLIAGAIGSFAADIAFGAFIFAPITLIVKGLEGYIVGTIAHSSENQKPYALRKVIGILTGAVVMVAGYYLAEAFLLGLFDETFGIVAANLELPLNLLQGTLSVAAAYPLYILLTRVNIRRLID